MPIKRILQGADIETVVNTDAIDDPSLIGQFAAAGRMHRAASTKS